MIMIQNGPIQDRIIGDYIGNEKGPIFICLAGIHGNEPAGILALQKIFKELNTQKPNFKGSLIGVIGNTVALSQKKRFIDADLNRQFSKEILQRIATTRRSELKLVEEQQQKELLTLFEYTLKRRFNQGQPVYLLDLHTTSAEGGTFVIANQLQESLRLATSLGVSVITGVEKVVKGTILEYFRKLGFTAIGFEAGQHDSKDSIDRTEATIWILLEKIGCLSMDQIDEFLYYKNLLAQLNTRGPAVVEFCYRHAISETDDFRMLPGFTNFNTIKKGQHLANDKNGEILAPYDGLILMPLYQKQGEDGFFIIMERKTHS